MQEIKVRRSYQKEGFTRPVFEYRPDWPYVSIGFGNEKDFFIENLALLISSGMGISSALEAMLSTLKSWKMKRIVKYVEESVSAGLPLWEAFEETKLFPQRVISIIKSGEESGRLPEHLNLVTLQLHKEKVFKSRIKSALLYPGIVLFLAFTVGLWISWFVLPKIVSVFNQPVASLPLATRVLLFISDLFKNYGLVAVPSLIVLAGILIYFLFVNKKTKFIGDYILFMIPGVRELVKGVEIGRFGYIFGALLQSGFLIDESLESIKQGSDYRAYRKFYSYLQESINKGETFKSSFASFKHSDRYIPGHIQQLIIASEKSGHLPETLIRIGVIFEEKTEAMSRDLATVLEPIVLVFVGLVVGFVLSAVITPIYELPNQI
jgi:type IV pilus assembly protein PilC